MAHYSGTQPKFYYCSRSTQKEWPNKRVALCSQFELASSQHDFVSEYLRGASAACAHCSLAEVDAGFKWHHPEESLLSFGWWNAHIGVTTRIL
jgi:hypothetical protein